MTADAFIHLPELRTRVTHPEKSRLRLTPEMFAMWEQRVRAAGWPADWRLPDEVIEASRLAVLGDHREGCDLWIYSYGSLMWDPGFHFAEVRLADVEGYARRFTLKINLGRGSHDHPALMLSLEPQEGCCRGLAFRIAADPPSMPKPRSCGAARCCAAAMRRRWCRCSRRRGRSRRLPSSRTLRTRAMSANCRLAETAAMIASGKGILGTNREYLVQLATQLDALGIQDPYVEQLHAQIAAATGA